MTKFFTPIAGLSGRVPVLLAAVLAASLPCLAQSTPETSPKTDDQMVSLSAFRVTSTQGTGYIAESATPFKTNQQLVDIPQSVMVVTRDMIDDIGGSNSSDIVIYAGAIPKYRSETFSMRGSNAAAGYPLVDGQISRSVFLDTYFVDSYDVIKGPAALLYPNSALSGVIDRVTKKPLGVSLNSIRGSVTSFGQYRTEVDSTGPLGMLGGWKVSYRFLGAYQDGKAYWHNAKDRRILAHPSLLLEHKDTSILLAYDHQDLTRPSNGSGIIRIDGRPFVGAGRDELNLPPGASERHKTNEVRGQLVQKFSEGWEAKFGGDINELQRRGSIVLPLGGVNFANNTLSFGNRKNDITLDHYNFSADVNGHYQLFTINQQSTFGVAATVMETRQNLWTNTDFTDSNGIANRIIRPLFAPDVNSLPVKPYDAYVMPANPGTKIRADLSNFYFQQNIDIIKDRVTLVGGLSRYSNETSNVSNIALRPVAATILRANATVHRVGAVVHITKEITVYAMQGTNQLPPTTAVLQNGNVVAPANGKGEEVGLKINLWDGKISGEVAAFKLETSGLTVFGGTLPPELGGGPYVLPVGSLTQKGFDGDIALHVTPQWQFVGSFYSGTVKDQAGLPIDDSYTGSWSAFTKYGISAVRGLSIGGGISRVTGRVVSTGSVTYPVGVPKPLFINVKPGLPVELFVNYSPNRNWALRLQVDNALDSLYAVGLNAAYLIDTSLPRTFTVSAKYTF
jgi:outer membrane receptor for ferric coprogen and ferric-rhodotorulic acid